MFPNEIVCEIVSYIPNVETRMNFNIIGKLSEKYEEILETTLRKPPIWTYPEQHHHMGKNLDFDNHNEGVFENDFIDINFNETDGNIHINLHIWKLLKRPYEGFTHVNDSYIRGQYKNTHYWKSVSTSYTI